MPPRVRTEQDWLCFARSAESWNRVARNVHFSPDIPSLPGLALFRVVGPARSDAARRFAARPSRPCLLRRIGCVSHAAPALASSLPPPASSLLPEIGFVSRSRVSVPARPGTIGWAMPAASPDRAKLALFRTGALVLFTPHSAIPRPSGLTCAILYRLVLSCKSLHNYHTQAALVCQWKIPATRRFLPPLNPCGTRIYADGHGFA